MFSEVKMKKIKNKILVMLVVIFLNIVLVYGRTDSFTLDIRDSALFDGKNITLVDSSDDSAVFCVNKEKNIVSTSKFFGPVEIDLKSSDEEKARFSVTFDCDDLDDCECDNDECNNNVCLNFREAAATTTTLAGATTTTDTSTTTTTEEITTTTTLPSDNLMNFENILIQISLVLLVILIILGIVVWARRR